MIVLAKDATLLQYATLIWERRRIKMCSAGPAGFGGYTYAWEKTKQKQKRKRRERRKRRKKRKGRKEKEKENEQP